ncbi:MAG: phage terminase large subunit [Oscillospiraceae bacterium]|nr:phage terminase large subunit [Oscillospiraceae bacterium]
MYLQELARRELARRDYEEYLHYCHGKSWKRTALSSFLAKKLQGFLERDTGHAYDILLIQTPPQHGKSTTVTETLPSWYLGRHPDRRVIVAGYSEDFAERFCRRNREKLQKFGADLFGVRLGKVNRAAEFELEGGGRMIARGLLSGITGNPAELLIVDDPIKSRQEADSPTIRDRIWEEWQNSLKSRFAAGAKVIVIMTPWHEDDLAGRMLRGEIHVELLRLPVEAEADDPMGRPIGAALCPELGKDDVWLRDFKRAYISDPKGGARAWAALYQCAPRVEDGELVKRSWWRRYDLREQPRFGTQVISVDAAFKGGESNDFVAVTVWGKAGNDYYLLDCIDRHLDFPGTLRAIRAMAKLYPEARAVLIEDKANGPAIIQTLQKELFCIPVTPKGGKVARAHAVSPAIEAGHVHIPTGVPWAEAFLDQWTAFPAGKHDDMVDSSSQALSWLMNASGSPPEPPPEAQTHDLWDVY